MGRVHHHFGGGDPRGPVEIGPVTLPMYHVETTAMITDEMLAAILCNLYNVGYFVQSVSEVEQGRTVQGVIMGRFRIIAYLRKG